MQQLCKETLSKIKIITQHSKKTFYFKRFDL